MIRSITSWHSESQHRWTAEQLRYRRHLKSIGPQLPRRLRSFVRRYTLHDDHFAGLQIVASVPSMRDALVAVHLYRDGIHGAAALLMLHFIGVRGAIATLPVHSDIMFFDIEVAADALRMSFAIDGKKNWSVRFRDFDFYLHDYENGPNQRPEGTPGKRPFCQQSLVPVVPHP